MYTLQTYCSLLQNGWRRWGVVDRDDQRVEKAKTTAKQNQDHERGDDGEGYGGHPWRSDRDEEEGLRGDGGPWREGDGGEEKLGYGVEEMK